MINIGLLKIINVLNHVMIKYGSRIVKINKYVKILLNVKMMNLLLLILNNVYKMMNVHINMYRISQVNNV